MNSMNRAEHYKQYFTKDYLMGPNSFRLLDELIRRNPYDMCWDRTLDLGCGMALTSVFLANETPRNPFTPSISGLTRRIT